MPTLHSQLDALAASFATQIIAAVRGATLHDLADSHQGGQGSNARRGRAVPRGEGEPDPFVARKAAKRGKSGRLPRRSTQEIQAALDKIVALVKTHKEGMRAEAIRAALGMQAKEMPRVLKEGVAKRKLSTKGQKRATTYFAK